MCQDNCNINVLKNKPLTAIELGKIESKSDEGKNETQIAKELGRDASTIQKEIKKFSTIVYTRNNCSYCKKYESCKQSRLCGYSLAEDRCNRLSRLQSGNGAM